MPTIITNYESVILKLAKMLEIILYILTLAKCIIKYILSPLISLISKVICFGSKQKILNLFFHIFLLE